MITLQRYENFLELPKIFAIFREKIEAVTDFFSHCVEGDAFGTTDVMFPAIVGPRTENKQTSSCTRKKPGFRRLVASRCGFI